DGNLTLAYFNSATLIGGPSSNTFDVSNWSGTATLDGQGGNNFYNLVLSGTGPGTFTVRDLNPTPDDINTLTITASGNTVITTTQVLVGAQQQVTYSAVEVLNVNGGVGGLTYDVRSILATVTAT